METIKFQNLQKSPDLNSFYPSISLVHLLHATWPGYKAILTHVHEQEVSMLS